MTNGAAIGYMILAAKQLGLSEDVIRQLEDCMTERMDFVSEDDAEDHYRSF